MFKHFIRGMARLVDFQHKIQPPQPMSDYEALKSDFEAVGMDIKTALQLEDEIYNDLQNRKRKAREAEARYWEWR